MPDTLPPINIDPSDNLDPTEEALFSRLPLLSHNSKADWLGFRACGFSVREACNLAEVTEATVRHWRNTDPVFKEWEEKRLPELQHGVASDILRLDFLRNMKLIFKKEFRLFWKALYNWDKLTSDEHRYLRTARSHYTPQDLLALEKALAPDAGEGDGRRGGVTVQVIVDERTVESEGARRVAVRELLDKFTVKRGNGPEAIEGEVRELGNGS
jgi:predicted small metal-binding protein